MINLNGVMSPNHHMDRTFGGIAVATIGAIVSSNQGDANRDMAEGFALDAKLERDKQEKKLDAQKAEYKAMKFTNPFANMENTFEDLTVNQQQAQFQARQGSQQRANIMQGLRGSAGSSGIAGLAQAMANQGQMQTQRISASIGAQESQNQMKDQEINTFSNKKRIDKQLCLACKWVKRLVQTLASNKLKQMK